MKSAPEKSAAGLEETFIINVSHETIMKPF